MKMIEAWSPQYLWPAMLSFGQSPSFPGLRQFDDCVLLRNTHFPSRHHESQVKNFAQRCISSHYFRFVRRVAGTSTQLARHLHFRVWNVRGCPASTYSIPQEWYCLPEQRLSIILEAYFALARANMPYLPGRNSRASSKVTLLTLPEEILFEVVKTYLNSAIVQIPFRRDGYIPYDPATGQYLSPPFPASFSILLSCKLLYRLASPILFDHITIEHRNCLWLLWRRDDPKSIIPFEKFKHVSITNYFLRHQLMLPWAWPNLKPLRTEIVFTSKVTPREGKSCVVIPCRNRMWKADYFIERTYITGTCYSLTYDC